MLELPYYNTFFKTATPPPIELAEKLAELTPEGLNQRLLRLLRLGGQRHHRAHGAPLLEPEGKPEKKTFISRDTPTTAAPWRPPAWAAWTPCTARPTCPCPASSMSCRPTGTTTAATSRPRTSAARRAKAVEDKILELGAETVAAFIGEPIQGAGGVIVPPETYWPESPADLPQHDVLLIADEVICGFGRTGHWFASELFGIEPDLMTLAKGITSGYLPLSAVMVGDRVAKTLIEEGGEFFHGFTYSGHPGGLRRGAGEHPHHRARRPDRARSATRPAPTCRAACASLATTRWSARSAASA